MIYPEEFEKLKESFQLFSGVGEKSAERFVYDVNSIDMDKIDEFAHNLINFKNNIGKCVVCGHISNADKCSICASETRDQSTICVVEDSKSVFMFEKTGKYRGLYHVLGGLISPIDEVNPEDINIYSLINNRIDEKVKEIIIALKPSVEGEMTSLYIQKLLENKNLKVSRLSYGIPMGADIEYLDPLTIMRAIDDRKMLS